MLEAPQEISERLSDTLMYRSMGLKVIPLIGKQPAIQSWKRYQKEMPTEMELMGWFQSGNLNMGIICDKIAVIDIDKYDFVERWCECCVDTPWNVKTPKGMHFYYRSVPGLRNAVRVHNFYDVRAGGTGYVVAAGSVVDGKSYELIGEVSLDLPKFDPLWLPGSSETSKRIIEPDDIRRVSRAKAYIATIFAISGQGGHASCFRCVCKLRDFGLTRSEAWALLLAWNRENSRPEWSEAELLHKLNDVFGKERS